MSDRMTPIPFGTLMNWAVEDIKKGKGAFGVRFPWKAAGEALEFMGEKLEAPFGPAAGPHTQLAQNLLAAYFAGARFFELKTVQILDGEELPVSKPCIEARDEGFNVEWSTELTVPQAMDEYIKGWYGAKLLSREFGLGAADGFIFNMSVGYDFEGICSPKISAFIEGLKDASATECWKECESWALANLPLFEKVDEAFVRSLSPRICQSITLSTLHGCPPAEIEKIASWLLMEKKLNTFVKCNPTLLGFEYTRQRLDELGFTDITFDERHFREDLQLRDAVPMLERLSALAENMGLGFGVKLTNTCPVNNPDNILEGAEVYMSGRALFPLTLEVARRLTESFDGRLRVSWSGGADAQNLTSLLKVGIWPVTAATTLLKPGGYQRLTQLAREYEKEGCEPFSRVKAAKLDEIAQSLAKDDKYRKPKKAEPERKIKEKLPLTDCFIAPCEQGCPIKQDIPEYTRLAGEGRYGEALSVILDKNPLPFITGTICNHHCTDKCTRNAYEEPLHIREIKLLCAEKGLEEALAALPKAHTKTEAKAAIIGGGPAGLAAAYFLGRSGIKATVFEKSSEFGGVVRRIIPDFRISGDAIGNDMKIAEAFGAEFIADLPVQTIEQLKKEGYRYIFIANGAWRRGELKLAEGQTMAVLDFLEKYKKREPLELGEYVVVAGGGNTAMDAARAAVRVPGVRGVSLVYRRTEKYMPADAEELALALADGVILRELLVPKSLSGGVLTCAKVKLGEADASGRRAPVETEELVEIPADTVITAVGEKVDSDFFVENGIKTDGRGLALCSEDGLTNAEGVYVIGDARRGPASVVQAIADARAAADAVILAEGLPPFEGRSHAGNSEESCADCAAKKGVLSAAGRVEKEPERCLQCSTLCENCADLCPNRANLVLEDKKGHPQLLHADPLCNECGNCETFCPWKGAPYKDKFTWFLTEKEFEDSKNSGYMRGPDEKFRVRLEGKEYHGTIKALQGELPAGVIELIEAAEKHPLIRAEEAAKVSAGEKI